MNPVMKYAEQLTRHPGIATAVTDLVAVAGGRRTTLEDARDVFIDRLHRASDDYAATSALALIYAAINAVDTRNLPENPSPKAARRFSYRSRAEGRRADHDQNRELNVARRSAATRNRSTSLAWPTQ
jgi:hypothetical protein